MFGHGFYDGLLALASVFFAVRFSERPATANDNEIVGNAKKILKLKSTNWNYMFADTGSDKSRALVEMKPRNFIFQNIGYTINEHKTHSVLSSKSKLQYYFINSFISFFMIAIDLYIMLFPHICSVRS